jgi:hypothetical protein
VTLLPLRCPWLSATWNGMLGCKRLGIIFLKTYFSSLIIAINARIVSNNEEYYQSNKPSYESHLKQSKNHINHIEQSKNHVIPIRNK